MAFCPLGSVMLGQPRKGPENSPRNSTSPAKREELGEDEWMTGLEEDWMTEDEESRAQDHRKVVECPPKGFKEYLPRKRKSARRKKAPAPRAPGDSRPEVLSAPLQESRYRPSAPSAPLLTIEDQTTGPGPAARPPARGSPTRREQPAPKVSRRSSSAPRSSS